MSIPIAEYPNVLGQNVDAHSVTINYDPWQIQFPQGHYLYRHLNTVMNSLGVTFNRAALINFYQNKDIDMVTKFLAAMIWGYAAPAGGQPARYGPWRVSKMFNEPIASANAINTVSLANNEQIVNSYNLLDGALKMCGPNFFTKHFYFLGKSSGMNQYPLIFDDRVAAGLVKIGVPPVYRDPLFNMVRVSAVRKPAEYINYLTYVQNQAALINCDLDQIEYYLFTL
jgi:hypothetical protein